jgi:hypothetical protein
MYVLLFRCCILNLQAHDNAHTLQHSLGVNSSPPDLRLGLSSSDLDSNETLIALPF